MTKLDLAAVRAAPGVVAVLTPADIPGKNDISPFGIHDMAGNVSEWTASEITRGGWPQHPDVPDLRVPAIRGGSFAIKMNDNLLTTRTFPDSSDEANLALGFRVASDTAPGSAPAGP